MLQLGSAGSHTPSTIIGVEWCERIAVSAVNHYRHFELNFAPSCTRRSIHMCNMRLPDEHFQFIINDAVDKVLFVDPRLIEKVEAIADQLGPSNRSSCWTTKSRRRTSKRCSYQELLGGQPKTYDWLKLNEECATRPGRQVNRKASPTHIGRCTSTA